jgi:2-amino-4-hydroxy-6-hydroxymethyldihydropteridine diphosphokinase
MRALLGFGSNLGDRLEILRAAVRSLDGVVRVSSVYETEPIGGPAGQPDHLNLVVELDTALSPRELLAVCHRLESAAERVREVRWGPRTLDVDVLWHEAGPVDEPDLIVPHPRLAERRFVLEPMAEIAPDLVAALAPLDWESSTEGQVRRLRPLS